MGAYAAYVLCAAPRSGSTLLCDLLAATGIAGRPASYLRAEDIGYWAGRWGIPAPGPRDSDGNRAYLAAMIRAGRGDGAMFGLRLMAASIADAQARFDAAHGGHAPLPGRFASAFGATLCIHLVRQDKTAQAISLVRARQTGLWHRAADGSERERTAPPRPPAYDAPAIAAARAGLTAQDAAWAALFAANGIRPLRLTYESLAADPPAILSDVLAMLGLDRAAAAAAGIGTRRLADDLSREWQRRFDSA